ncbi:olfactory receptor 14J1-like [Protobothrops mucrosquamatus]|uniref:olfactory receptor 14J1-like n=1 Tax=Protobothrops mucrosquamatus TaxID=103944 RepID=UPI0010FB155F|nr:olfactory receptor 14J1-like [Protobothrops mucrosquamatus]
MDNQSTDYYFLLMEFSEVREQQILYFLVFLVMYFVVVTGNLLITFAIIFNHHLHTPMYFFLLNLAIQDLVAISVILPKSMANILMNTRYISYRGCICQVFFLVFFLGSDLWVLTVMAYDRYVAICNPLQYEKIMNKQACIYMILAVWISNLLNGLLHTSAIFETPFCSNIINQFFCEIPKLLKLSCTGLNKNEIKVIVVFSVLAFVCFFFILYTYVSIFTAVLKIHSLEGRKKAVSTCLPHVIVVSIFLLSGFFAHLKPSSTSLDLISALLYCVIPPCLNPVIYSMRNRDIKIALSKVLNIRKMYKKISNIKCISG